ncbi:MAG TPA: hypothetical protein VF885_13615 [Arthrobacter sp.]
MAGIDDSYHPPMPDVPDIRIVFPPLVVKAPPSGSRTVAGLAAIVLGLFQLLQFVQTGLAAKATGSGSFTLLAVLFLVAALGNTSCGAALLAGRRGRRPAVAIPAAGFAVLAVLLCLADVASVGYSPAILIPTLAATLAPALTVLMILIGAGLGRVRRSGPDSLQRTGRP